MLDQLIELDKTLLVFLNNLGSVYWDDFWAVVTNKRTFIPLYIVLLYFMSRTLNKKTTFVLVLLIASMILFTDQILCFTKKDVFVFFILGFIGLFFLVIRYWEFCLIFPFAAIAYYCFQGSVGLRFTVHVGNIASIGVSFLLLLVL